CIVGFAAVSRLGGETWPVRVSDAAVVKNTADGQRKIHHCALHSGSLLEFTPRCTPKAMALSSARAPGGDINCLDPALSRCLRPRLMTENTRRQFIRLGFMGSAAFLLRPTWAEAAVRSLIVRSARPQDLETPVDALLYEYTPNDIFFVRSHFGPPVIDLTPWKLHIEGMVERPLELSMEQLRRIGTAKAPAVLQCAGNGRALFQPKVAGAQWERGAVGQALWRGGGRSGVRGRG